MEGVQGSGAPHQPPTHTGVGFSGVVMMPVLSTRTRRGSSMLELASDSMFTPQPPTQDHQSWVREANIDKLIGPLCLDKRDGAVTERDTSSTRSRYLSPRRRRPRTKSTQEDKARLLFANLPATSDWFQWPAGKAKADSSHSYRLPALHPSLVRVEPRVTTRAPHGHRTLINTDATSPAPSAADVLEVAMAAATADRHTQTQTPKPPPPRQARQAISGLKMFAASTEGHPVSTVVVPQPQPQPVTKVKSSGCAYFGVKAKETKPEEENPLLIQTLHKLGADLSHMHGHALPDLLEQAAIPRRSRTKIATVALTMNPYASNAHAAEQASQLMHQKVVYAMSRLDATKLNPGSKLAPRQFSDSLIELSANRPYFLSPRMGSDQRRLGSDRLQRRGGRRGSRDGLSDQKAWQIDSSIFARRRLEAEGKQYFDTLDIFKRRCQVDWKNAIQKKRFLMVMARNDDDGFAGLKEELQEVEDEFNSVYPMLVRVFDYYCCKSNALDESVFAMSLGGWRFMVRDFALATHKSKFCKPADCDNIFIATNYEEDPDSDLGQANDDLALMRFELLEALTRVGILKFGKDLGIFDISDSVNGLLQSDVVPGLTKNPLLKDLLIHRNVFKRRLYTQACAEALEGQQSVLKAMYCFFKGKERKRTMQIAGWIRCCELLGWTGRDRDGDVTLGLSYTQAKMAYLCSQMCCTDEVKLHARCVSLSWVEFLEALARVAEFMQPASAEEEAAWVHESVHTDWDAMNQVVSTARWEKLNAAAGNTNEVPLHAKLQRVLDNAIATMHGRWFTSSSDALVKKLNTLTTTMGSSVVPY